MPGEKDLLSEIQKDPRALKSALEAIDTNHDKKLSRDELTQWIWQNKDKLNVQGHNLGKDMAQFGQSLLAKKDDIFTPDGKIDQKKAQQFYEVDAKNADLIEREFTAVTEVLSDALDDNRIARNTQAEQKKAQEREANKPVDPDDIEDAKQAEILNNLIRLGGKQKDPEAQKIVDQMAKGKAPENTPNYSDKVKNLLSQMDDEDDEPASKSAGKTAPTLDAKAQKEIDDVRTALAAYSEKNPNGLASPTVDTIRPLVQGAAQQSTDRQR